MQFEKPLKVGKVERFEVDLSSWLNGEVLQSATVEPDITKATLTTSDISGGVVGFFLTGLGTGACKVHLNYTTATRSDCLTVIVIVLNC